MEHVTVILDGLEVALECSVESDCVYVEEVEQTDTISSEVAEFLFNNHEAQLATLAQNKYDEAKRSISPYGQRLMDDIKTITEIRYWV